MYTGFTMPANRMQRNCTAAMDRPCVIYDVFKPIDDPNKVIRRCDSIGDAATFLIVNVAVVSNIIKNKSRHKSKLLDRVITVR